MWYKPLIRPINLLKPTKQYSQIIQEKSAIEQPSYMRLSEAYSKDNEAAAAIIRTMSVYYNFISSSEEQSIMDEIEPYMKRMRYQFEHWDDAIHAYRETERLKWNVENTKIIDRVRKLAFPPQVKPLKLVHILDLEKDGHIKPHIDAVRFCGDTIAGLSLLTDSVMRLVHDKRPELQADVLLKQRSLYIMTGTARYDYKHEILSNEHSKFDEKQIYKGRRVSVICRNEPRPEDRA